MLNLTFDDHNIQYKNTIQITTDKSEKGLNIFQTNNIFILKIILNLQSIENDFRELRFIFIS